MKGDFDQYDTRLPDGPGAPEEPQALPSIQLYTKDELIRELQRRGKIEKDAIFKEMKNKKILIQIENLESSIKDLKKRLIP